MLYMPETTVKAAKLYAKSVEELGKLGIGKDAQGYYLVSSANVSVPVPKTGAFATLRAISNVVKSAADVIETVVGAKASDKEVDRRKAICMTCFDVDAAGRRLFRFNSPDRMSCGQPMDPRADGSKLLRDPIVDGCGCWLQDKWVGRDQACPHGKWGAEPGPPIRAANQTKRRCCGQR